MKKLYFILFVATAGFSYSQVLSEDFNYADGNLAGQGGWSVHSGDGGTDILVSSGAAVLTHGSGSREDLNRSFTAITSGTVYYAFDLSVSDTAPISGVDSEYFAHFNANGFTARIDIVPPSTTGDYSIGISTAGNTANETWATDLSFGTTYRVIVRYDIDSGESTLWVDATSETDTSISGGATGGSSSISAFAFRQSDSTSDETITVDNLIVSQVFSSTLSNSNTLVRQEFSIYPNPTNTGEVTITSASNSNIDVAVYDVLGKQVKSARLVNNRMDVSDLKTGLYILNIKQDNATTTKKLVIR